MWKLYIKKTDENKVEPLIPNSTIVIGQRQTIPITITDSRFTPGAEKLVIDYQPETKTLFVHGTIIAPNNIDLSKSYNIASFTVPKGTTWAEHQGLTVANIDYKTNQGMVARGIITIVIRPSGIISIHSNSVSNIAQPAGTIYISHMFGINSIN